MREVDIVRQGPGELHEQSIQGPEPVAGHGVHQTFKVFVPVAVKAHFSGFLLGREGLEGACAVEAAVRAVRRAGDQTVPPGARVGPGHGVGPRRPVRLLSLLEVFKLNTSAERHVVGHYFSVRLKLNPKTEEVTFLFIQRAQEDDREGNTCASPASFTSKSREGLLAAPVQLPENKKQVRE